MNPLISVIIPAHHREALLLRAVRSVLSQSYTNFELIVVDDGQTLSQEFLIQDELKMATVLRQGHQGVAQARNNGIENSQGEWIAFLDSDDYWLPEKLQTQIEFVRNYPEIKILQNREIWFRHNKRANLSKQHVMHSGNLFSDSVNMCVISPSSVMLHKSVLETCGQFDSSMTVCEDYDLWLRITAHFEVGLVEDALTVKFGGHQDQLSRSMPAMDRFRVFALLKLLEANKLGDGQAQIAVKALQKKALILKLGAIKRKLLTKARIYEKIETIHLPFDFALLKDLAEEIRRDLEKPQDFSPS
jgi:glycosyltransferase involved in cell wall biosynthesis